MKYCNFNTPYSFSDWSFFAGITNKIKYNQAMQLMYRIKSNKICLIKFKSIK